MQMIISDCHEIASNETFEKMDDVSMQIDPDSDYPHTIRNKMMEKVVPVLPYHTHVFHAFNTDIRNKLNVKNVYFTSFIFFSVRLRFYSLATTNKTCNFHQPAFVKCIF